MNDVRIGVAIWRKRIVEYQLKLKAEAIFTNGQHSRSAAVKDPFNSGSPLVFRSDDETHPAQQYPRMVYPKGDFKRNNGTVEHVNELNTDIPYTEDEDGTPTHPYCNIALCYQKQGYEKKLEDGSKIEDYSSEPSAIRGYEYMPANRVNSAPNFFVIYWIRSLMEHLGIYIEENQMMDVEDLRRLFFVNTNCAYREPSYKYQDPLNVRWYQFANKDRYLSEHIDFKKTINVEESSFSSNEGEFEVSGLRYSEPVNPDKLPTIKNIVIRFDSDSIIVDDELKRTYLSNNSILHEAFATGECFPNADISEVIHSIENGFGVRFIFNGDYNRVRIVLLRNLFRNKEVQDIECELLDDHKTENNIRGFRMTYGESEDTHFYYKGFADALPHKDEIWVDDTDKHDYSKWDFDASYSKIIHKASAFDKTCYVTKNTGNAYGIKVDKDAKRYDDLHPSTFEFAGFMDAEDGDCTGEEETIKTINVGFRPAIMNDLNMEDERNGTSTEQCFALFVDEEMRPRRYDFGDLEPPKSYNDSDVVYDVDKLYAGKTFTTFDYKHLMNNGIVKPGEFFITSDMYAHQDGLRATISKTVDSIVDPNDGIIPVEAYWDVTMNIDGHINEGYRLYLQDNFEPNDEGISPIEKHDWGITLGIMRGSGSDSYVDYMADLRDGEGNDTWEIIPGSSVTAHADTCDNYGKLWDYNGTQEGVGDTDGRISLKLRSEKPNPKYNPKEPESDKNRRYLETTDPNLRGRGIADKFYKEYSYFIRNSRIDNMQINIELAKLLAIDKTKRTTIGDVTGFVRKMKYTFSNKSGLGLVDIEMMYI